MISKTNNIEGFSIAPFEGRIEQIKPYKIQTTNDMQTYMSGIACNIPALLAADKLSSTGLYTLRFPEGVNGVLVELKRGGHITTLRDPATGKFVGTASLHEANFASEAALLNTLTAMSIVTSQYFLAEINSKLKLINQKLDKILEFLYGNKKAELISEINFTRYAYQNYSSIMQHDEQRIATIASLQNARKTAMKDIEFYMYDMDSTVNSDAKNAGMLDDIVKKFFQIYESVETSMQLYAVSMLLEIYYSQNTNSEYLSYLENEFVSYIEKCDKHALADLSILGRRVNDFSDINPFAWKLDKAKLSKRIEESIEALHDGNSLKFEDIRTALQNLKKPAEYVLSENGELFNLEDAV